MPRLGKIRKVEFCTIVMILLRLFFGISYRLQ